MLTFTTEWSDPSSLQVSYNIWRHLFRQRLKYRKFIQRDNHPLILKREFQPHRMPPTKFEITLSNHELTRLIILRTTFSTELGVRSWLKPFYKKMHLVNPTKLDILKSTNQTTKFYWHVISIHTDCIMQNLTLYNTIMFGMS